MSYGRWLQKSVMQIVDQIEVKRDDHTNITLVVGEIYHRLVIIHLILQLRFTLCACAYMRMYA